MISNKIDDMTRWLFNRTYGVSSKEQRKETKEKVKQQISEFGWEKTFESWINYHTQDLKKLYIYDIISIVIILFLNNLYNKKDRKSVV